MTILLSRSTGSLLFVDNGDNKQQNYKIKTPEIKGATIAGIIDRTPEGGQGEFDLFDKNGRTITTVTSGAAPVNKALDTLTSCIGQKIELEA